VLKRSFDAITILLFVVSVSALHAQNKPSPSETATSTGPSSQNLDAYVALLRKDVRSQKSEVMSEVMQLDPEQAAKFWPIYRDYDAELTKINDLRVANIKEYAASYNQMTDAKADDLIRNGLAYRKQRMELLTKYYERVKQEMGAVTAARFVQVEDQLLMIIDLQIASALPIAGT
jgi:hypothetical protein